MNKRRPIPVRLASDLIARLDAIAARDGMTRSELMRAAIAERVRRDEGQIQH